MIPYLLTVTHKGRIIFTQELVMSPERSFSDDVKMALDAYRSQFPNLFIYSDDVQMKIERS